MQLKFILSIALLANAFAYAAQDGKESGQTQVRGDNAQPASVQQIAPQNLPAQTLFIAGPRKGCVILFPRPSQERVAARLVRWQAYAISIEREEKKENKNKKGS